MSAIWGAINLKGGEISETTAGLMRKAFDKCKIDRYEELRKKNIYLGCGIQYFVPEAEKECLPYESDGCYLDADVVLDNRQEIYDIIGITQAEGDLLPDGRLLFEIYNKKGKECLNDLLGAYTFAWYDSHSRKLEIVLDAVGNRCLYYTMAGNTFFFSSLLEPLVQLSDKVMLNDSWFTDFLGQDGVILFNDTESTPFQNIYRVAPAQYICIDSDCGITKEIYWNPFENGDEYLFETDNEYKKMFLDKWSKAVTDTLRGDEISILLSGGLDSTAVAAMAAPYLKQKNKKLYSYTSIPADGYQVDTSGKYIENESENVRKTAEYYGNIETTFIALNQTEPWSKSQEEIRILEFPYKAVQNSLWIVESMKQAYEKGSRILLTGAYGNISISYNGLKIYANSLYKSKQNRKLYKELNKFSQTNHFPVKNVLKAIERTFEENYFEALNLYGESFVKRDLAKKAGTTERLGEIEKRTWEDQRDYKSALHSNINWIAMRQIGEIQTKHSLATGVLVRDPTCDKRILEFCIRLPISQYSKEGVSRRLVKVYMKDLIPHHILEEQGKGSQSADILYRMTQNWKQIRKEWIDLYQRHVDSRYVETFYAKQQLIDKEDINCFDQFELVRHMYTIFALQYEGYVKKHYGKKEVYSSIDTVTNNMNSMITVVVYVHNDEEWIGECLRSITEQTYPEIEILLFDDESNDKSGSICDDWAQKNHRIKVFHQKYNGVYATYKNAIKIAAGHWVAFLNGSDYVEKDFYLELHKRAEENNVDLICCDSYKDINGQDMSLYYDKNILYQYMYGTRHEKLPQEIHNYLYKKDILKCVSSEINDTVWNFEAMEQVHKCIVVYTKNFYIKGRKITKQTSVDHIISEKKIKLEMTDKYFSPQLGKDTLLDYYKTLLKIYRRSRQYSEVDVQRVKSELQNSKKAVRPIIRNSNESKKNRIFLWLSTYVPFP